MEDVKQLAPDQIMNLGLAFWGSKTLLSAVEIGLFTELAKEPLDLETLSERLMLHPRSARDFLDALVAPMRGFGARVSLIHPSAWKGRCANFAPRGI